MHISGNAAILKSDRSLFGRMIVIAQSLQLNMRAIFVHPLGPILWALATPECFPRKISKAVLAHHLQKGAALKERMHSRQVCNVIDGMSVWCRRLERIMAHLERLPLLLTSRCSKKDHTVRGLTLCLTPTGTRRLRMLSELCGATVEEVLAAILQ